MLTAAIDSAAVVSSVAIAEITDGILGTYSLFTVKNRLTHSETLMPMLDSALSAYGAAIGDIGLFAVNVGPGSFTGVRIGVATVKGLATPHDIPCAAVSTLASLARNGGKGYSLALMDARREQFYYALFRDGKRVSADAADGIGAISGLLGDIPECTVYGDGARLFADKYSGNCNIILPPETACDQNALSVALCGNEIYLRGETVSAGGLKPVYLRMPQAEREKLEREKGEKK